MQLPEWMLIPTLRYCLGRSTYVVSDFVDFVLENWESISDRDKDIMIKEIIEAGKRNRLGMEMDEKEWQKILKKCFN